MFLLSTHDIEMNSLHRPDVQSEILRNFDKFYLFHYLKIKAIWSKIFSSREFCAPKIAMLNSFSWLVVC